MPRDWKVVFRRIKVALLRRGRTDDEADDLMQEAWVRLADYERRKPVAEPEAFLMRAALNLSLDAYRAKRIRGDVIAPDEVVLVDSAPGVEATLLGRERISRLSECLGQLNSKTRDILLEHRVDGMSYQEIAELHGLSVSAVEKHVAKAMLQLTSWMEGW